MGSLAWFTSVKRLTAFWRRSTTFRGRRVWKVDITNRSRCLFQKLLTDEPEMPIFRFCGVAIQNQRKRSPGLSSYLYLKKCLYLYLYLTMMMKDGRRSACLAMTLEDSPLSEPNHPSLPAQPILANIQKSQISQPNLFANI